NLTISTNSHHNSINLKTNNTFKKKISSSRILKKTLSNNNKFSIKPPEDLTFDEKIINLKNNLLVMKVDWRDAHCNLELNRQSMLQESMKQFDKIDLYKELKINFKGEVSYDAGGIIR